MADADYQRLGAACHCGEPVRFRSGRGRPPKYCEGHTGPPRPAAKEIKECPACRGIFIPTTAWQVYCATTCGYRTRRGNKPFDEVRSYTCAHCARGFESSYARPMYCGNACKVAACKARSPELTQARALRAVARFREANPPKSPYFAKICTRCSASAGYRRDWTLCASCRQDDKRAKARELYLDKYSEKITAAKEAKHRELGRTLSCEDCAAVFCPLYGKSQVRMCVPCADARTQSARKRNKRIAKVKRRAIERGVEAESVDPLIVLSRDGWCCRLCGLDAPQELRGTFAHNAPELDHIRPLSRGGAHTYANTQCLCRSCNGFKSDRTMNEVLHALAV